MKINKNKAMAVSILLITMGVICLFLESTFYGSVDNDGTLQESLFLPLGMLCLLSGIFISLAVSFTRVLNLFFKRK